MPDSANHRHRGLRFVGRRKRRIIVALGSMVAVLVWIAVARTTSVTPETVEGDSVSSTGDEPVEIAPTGPPQPVDLSRLVLQPRQSMDTSGLLIIFTAAGSWDPQAPLPVVAERWEGVYERAIQALQVRVDSPAETPETRRLMRLKQACCAMSAGRPEEAYQRLTEARALLDREGDEAVSQLAATVMFLQGVAALRRGETENCILCRGESSCILPISPAAVHQNPEGSTLAIRHFMEYLEYFPDDLEARWLLNVAHMTLGQHPDGVDPRFVISLDRFRNSADDIGRFRDIGHLVGLNRFNQAGGAIMEDFDNDGLLDVVTSTMDPTTPLAVFRNTGEGDFEERSAAAGVAEQLGGLNCVQTDYNNDGLMDIFIPRGAWLALPVRPSLLRNDGGLHFTDVTEESGLLVPVKSNAAMWADYDNDGWLDLFVCCEKEKNRLFHNRGNSTFEEVAESAGVAWDGLSFAKGCTWIDYDNDDYPDLFVNCLEDTGKLYHNQRNGTFQRVSAQLGIDGPKQGFACWTWDFNNDGWLDIFATSYDRSLADVVKGLIGEPHARHSNCLYRNRAGETFEDVTAEAGLDMVFATMGCNFADFDNDGLLDMYLGTGDPSFSTLVPNRMFRNADGEHFVEITGTAGVGHLQKGHGVACGDWDRDGNVDLFIEMGGAIDGDRYHNILFQNPGHNRAWLTVKLVGVQTNRPAVGARLKVVTAGAHPITIHRHITSGSSFGANPLQQTIGLGAATRVETLEVHWPTSGTTQVFHDLDVNQSLQVTEFAETYEVLDWSRIPLKEPSPLPSETAEIPQPGASDSRQR